MNSLKCFVSVNIYVGSLIFVLMLYFLFSSTHQNISYAELPSLFVAFSVISLLLTEVFTRQISRPIQSLNTLVAEFNATGKMSLDSPTNNIELLEIAQLRQYLIFSFNQVEQKILAEAANRSKSEFLANMSHDFVTALTCINGQTEMLKNEQDSDKRNGILDNINTTSSTVLNLLKDILSFSKLEHSKAELRLDAVSLKKIFNDVDAMLSVQAKIKGLKLNMLMEDISIVSDRNRLTRIIMNLLGNAIKFTEKGSVDVSAKFNLTQADDGFLLLIISDTGLGIARDQYGMIFEQFTKLKPAYEDNEMGAGLGLAIAKRFVEELGGQIKVDSVVGEGSTFTIKIPCKRIKDLDWANKADEQVSIEQKSVNVLLVEDNQVICEITKRHLESLGCRVDIEMTAKATLANVCPQHDLIILDIGLPDKDGFYVARQIRNNPNPEVRNIPIVGHTAHLDESEKEKAFDAGMNLFVSKPTNKAKFAEMIDQLVINK